MLLPDLARQAAEAAKRAGQPLHLGALDVGPPVPLRPQAVQRALGNLIGNALRYGAKAELSLSRGPGRVIFVVEDDGPGIPEDRREEALRPFIRLDPARNQDRGSGVGLGLSIVADIARVHGGSLRLGDSPGLGGLRAELILAV